MHIWAEQQETARTKDQEALAKTLKVITRQLDQQQTSIAGVIVSARDAIIHSFSQNKTSLEGLSLEVDAKDAVYTVPEAIRSAAEAFFVEQSAAWRAAGGTFPPEVEKIVERVMVRVC